MILTPLVAKLNGTLDRLVVRECQRNINLEDSLELSRILVHERSEWAGSRSILGNIGQTRKNVFKISGALFDNNIEIY